MKEMRIAAVRSGEKAKVRPATAAEILERCRRFYEDTENEKAFREWLKEKKSR